LVAGQSRRIVIPGGSGQVGTILARAFIAGGHEVGVLSRKPVDAPWRVVQWDAQTLGDWAGELEGADALVNLAGRFRNGTRPHLSCVVGGGGSLLQAAERTTE
jgi:NAD dependent epimerase/dehydratase family enzyme